MSDPYTIRLPVNRDLGDASPTLVLPSSPVSWRRSTEAIAYFFKRELHYDFPQFEASEQPESEGYVPYEAWLFHEPAYDRLTLAQAIAAREIAPPRRVIGAASFRQRIPEGWMLDWVWFHPYERHQGHLSKTWPMFEQRYGEFPIQPPISLAMKAFMKKARPVSPPPNTR